MKKFRPMTVREKIAWLCGWNIWSNEELATWNYKDVEFYLDRIVEVNKKFVLLVSAIAIVVMACLLFVSAILK